MKRQNFEKKFENKVKKFVFKVNVNKVEIPRLKSKCGKSKGSAHKPSGVLPFSLVSGLLRL